MTDRREASPWLRLFGGFVVSAGLAFSPQVLAQQEREPTATEMQEEAPADAMGRRSEESQEPTEEIVVTGSRLKRDTYSSIAPLQIITGQISREVGLIDAADILQESTAASGQQIDLTFQGFVLDNGPGATTINLRGLGDQRTLVLINGRRLAPAGVEGAPVSPDLNFVPTSLVQQYDLLLDGASSVYGSDAIAGVANIILRKDFDGFELEAYSRVPEHGAGVDNTLSAAFGMNFDRGFFAIGAEYVDSERVTFDDRPWTAGCNKHHEITEDGEIRSQEVFYNAPAPYGYGMEWDECEIGLLAARVAVPYAGSIYYTPGYTNGGWTDFSESNSAYNLAGQIFRWGIDGNGDGATDLTFRDYSLNGNDNDSRDLFPDITTQNAMAYGEYTFAGEANITPYFEVLYAEREFFSHSRNPQFFPVVPGNNPFSLCNPNAPGGVDCGDAFDAMLTNPNYVAQFQDLVGDLCAQFGIQLSDCTPENILGLAGPIGGGATTQPIVSVRDDRNTTDVSGSQIRGVVGVRGDMPFMQMGTLDNWTFDTYYSYSFSEGESHRLGIREDRFDYSVGWYSTSNNPCENDVGADLSADVTDGCVPINMFAPSLYPNGVVGDFATQAERDYVFDSRDFDTEYTQQIFSAYATGDIFNLPAGPVALGLGIEYRDDEINSLPDDVARDGLFFGFFSDGGAVGKKQTKEAFGEIELPIVAGKPAFEELNLNFSSRLTDDEIYGQNWTWSGKLGWRPADSLLLRTTYGTAFRAPNLRDLYLADQTGFGNIFDPCYVPPEAWDDLTDSYIPSLDTRSPIILQNCQAQGIDPTVAYNGGFSNVFSVEQSQGGSLTLDPETSTSWSAGLSWEQPFSNAFDFSISATYYEVEVKDTIIDPSGQYIVNDCYSSPTGTSVFCDRITRAANATAPRINFIDRGFLNRDQEKARGVDINLTFEDTFTMFERPIDFSMDIVANRNLERSTLFVNPDTLVPDAETYQGEWGFPHWRVQGLFRFDYDDFRFTWETRYTGSVHQKESEVDPLSDAFANVAPSDTCSGPAFGDVLCRDYADAGNYFLHNISMYYYGDRWTIGGGIRNVFDEAPPIVDVSNLGAPLAVNNTPLGYGYDLNGRVYFFNVAASFGGGS